MPALGGRRLGIAAGSAALHVVLVVVVAAYAPRLLVPNVASGPPEPIIPVLIMPRTPPAAVGPNAKPTPIRLHRRPQRFVPAEDPVAPLLIPQIAPPRPLSAPIARQAPLPSSRDEVADTMTRVLRGSLGCANANAIGLSRAEREACEDELAAGAQDAPFTGLGVARGKAAGYDAAASRKAADVRFRERTGGVGVTGTGRKAAEIERPGAPNLGMGTSAHDLGAALGNDRPALKVPF